MGARAAILLSIALTPLPTAFSDGPCTTSIAYAAVGQYYVVIVDQFGWIHPVAWYVYEETNGVAGLQRNDEFYDDTASGTCYPSDTIVT